MTVVGGVATVLVATVGLSPMTADAATAPARTATAAVAPTTPCPTPIYEVRTYTLATAAAAQAYLGVWERHVASLKAFGIETLIFELTPGSDVQVRALVAYPAGADPAVLDVAYRASPGFAADVAGFDFSQLRGVQSRLVAGPSFD